MMKKITIRTKKIVKDREMYYTILSVDALGPEELPSAYMEKPQAIWKYGNAIYSSSGKLIGEGDTLTEFEFGKVKEDLKYSASCLRRVKNEERMLASWKGEETHSI